jgi:SAM-dependent methyltransferase
MEFDRFGRRLGRSLLARGSRNGLSYLLAPVSIVRYFEFPFVLACLPTRLDRCLDVSSPRLFSLYVAANHADASISVINPDESDIFETRAIVSRLGQDNLHPSCQRVEDLRGQRNGYDCIWSISVIEHIAGEDGDTDAVKLLYEALAPGGRLILTVPVDRQFRTEFRDLNYYGTQGEASRHGYFFARAYDKESLLARIVAPVAESEACLRWFGERSPGRYASYERRWMANGLTEAIEDPREIATHYREYHTWEEMPGMGVCGLAIDKPSA